MLDTLREVHTPEGVALRLPVAGPLPRALAWTTDAAIRGAGMLVASMLLGLLGESGTGLFLVLAFLLLWVYPVVFEVLRDGQTPGKRAMGLRVIREDGAPVGWQASIVRNLLRTVDMLPFGYATGLVCGLFDPAGRRLGDIVAGTLVIHSPAPLKAPAAGAAGAQPPPLAAVGGPPPMLLPHEQAAVVAFSERAQRLTPERQRELADIVAGVLEAPPATGVARLHGIAAWLLGR